MSTLLRRILHAVLFEVGALLTLVPLASWLLGVTLVLFGALALMLSITAMACNMLYNHIFEWLERRYAWQRTLPVRVGHAIGFEIVLTFATVPLTVWWLSIGWLQAFMLDMGLTVFFMVYGFCFNWLYDMTRKRLAAQPAS
jgi:uncharacterized membrane protein